MIACRLMLAAAVSSCSLVAGLTLSASTAMALTPPVIEEVSVLNVAGTSATFQAKIDPQGSETTYRFEYGTSAAYGSSIPAPDGLVGSGYAGVTVSAHPQDLTANTTYHYRVVALVASRSEAVPGSDGTFTTQRSGSEFALSDGRQWELVSPPNKRGALILPLSFGNAVQAAEDGSAITYMTNVATDPEPQGYELFQQTVSRRGAQGWSTHGITIPKSSSVGLNGGASDGLEYKLFSSDLSAAFTEPGRADSLLSTQASEQTLYIRRESLCGASASECFLPLVTGKEGFANVPPGTKFEIGSSGLYLSGASPDLRHVAFGSSAALTETPIPATASELYEWSAGAPAAEALQMISVLPASEGGGPTKTFYNYVGTAGFSGRYTGNRHAISDDGSRIFWSGGDSTPVEALYMRDMLKRETVRLDVPQPGAPSVPSGSGYLMLPQIASSDGSKVFFTGEGRSLTAQSGTKGRDLYECEMLEEAGKWTCRLTDLTPQSMGHSAEVQHMVLGASEDGSYLYFVANGILGDAAAHGAIQGTCENASLNATCNLYEYHNGKITFIASLIGEDATDWGQGGELATVTARVSPDGRYLAFMSGGSLTGYNNRDASSGQPDQEVFLYDAQGGRLVCASCNPTGSRPSGVQAREFGGLPSFAKHNSNLADVGYLAGESWIAANLPGGDNLHSQESLYQSRLLRDDGRLFFNSSDALMPQDINGQEDVYQFEPEGIGGCTTSSVTFNARSGGCVSLISSGTSPDESGFVDASATGGDVFFLTDSRLGSQDYDMSFDVYDAHECSTAVPCVPASVSSPPCTTGDSCKGAPSPQPLVFGAPASATFAGAGNVRGASSASAIKPRSLTRAQKLVRALRACRKKPKPKRAACERQARRRYAKGARKAAGATRKARG